MIDPGELADRERAIHERGRNVVIEASAGTGKTTLVIERLLALVAPHDDSVPIPIERIAAITFTRKAAGELRVRARQRLLTELATLPPETARAALVARALAGLDTATISTIHGFADRLLRRWPAHAQLDPHYQLDDDTAALADECFRTLVDAAERGTLAEALHGSVHAARTDEATATLQDIQRAGIRLRSHATEHWTYHGLDGLVASFVVQRDVDIAEPELVALDRAGLERYAAELVSLVSSLSDASAGGRWLRETADTVARAIHDGDAAVTYREIVPRLERGPKGRASDAPRLATDFAGDRRAWDAWKAFAGDARAAPVRATPLRDDLLRPLRGWLATRIVRLRPVVLELYRRVKARQRAVDQLDLLMGLRDLLRANTEVRRECQALFDHVFVDEFQDTDPLQAEIVVYLCEHGAHATRWRDAVLTPGKLTIVGDPKQSIYRFRRADITTYRQAIDVVRNSAHLVVSIAASFRTVPVLVAWVNERFATILRHPATPEAELARAGEVAYRALACGRADSAETGVHVVPIAVSTQASAADCRRVEATGMARYLRWLIEVSATTIVDPGTGARRRIGYGDVAVLALATTHLPLLFAAYDREGVPYASRGGTLFLADPLQRRFLLGLLAIADRDDGVAVAALLRPPFFALDLADLARESSGDPGDPVAAARSIVREVRRRRFERGVGVTARALLEESAIGRVVALGANGAQRLAALRELCCVLERMALEHALDFDGVMERARVWLDRPAAIDRPHPVGEAAVRIVTVHQAKGLEFPVVVLWDGRAAWSEQPAVEAWSVERTGQAWSVRLDTLKWDEPAGLDASARDRACREAERKRLVYVAATRARDLLVVPQVGARDARYIHGRLLDGAPAAGVVELATHAVDHPAPWFIAAAPPCREAPTMRPIIDDGAEGWHTRAAAASRGSRPPSPFAAATAPRETWGRPGRFGTAFGVTVHLAIGIVLQRECDVVLAVDAAAQQTRLRVHLREAAADVERALRTLAALEVTTACSYALEYPVSGISPSGALVSGYIDLVASLGGRMLVIDFKTDDPPSVDAAIEPRYRAQVEGYAAALRAALRVRVDAGLLYTADGVVRWLPTCEAP